MSALTTRQRRLLEFEREWWRHAGDKATAVRTRFDLDLDAYHHELETFIHSAAALEADRMLALRLRRLSAQRARSFR